MKRQVKATILDHVELGIDFMRYQSLIGERIDPEVIRMGLEGLTNVINGKEAHTKKEIMQKRLKILNKTRVQLSKIMNECNSATEKVLERIDDVVHEQKRLMK